MTTQDELNEMTHGEFRVWLKKVEEENNIFAEEESAIRQVAKECGFFIDEGWISHRAYKVDEDESFELDDVFVHTFPKPVRSTEALLYFLDNHYGLVGWKQGMRYVQAHPKCLKPGRQIILLGTLWKTNDPDSYRVAPVLDLTFFRHRRRVQCTHIGMLDSSRNDIGTFYDFLVYKKTSTAL
ncbi:MAG: hypothetical protein US42_C0003G0025 [Candidatus Magasanikbacteria bacterium GW2011_GWC2_37_14]|uniref:Uncharacterized protein n=1 Tax=Candidatus Magasanikbacteria bacterium GW2011_GWC2_37_14 TaxID=1619046 RepID=A0A0G0GA23_9BACT|nr:MAG: hypothetical protein US42_C0003G0025 [Candidatus Magasanikbacteria bacterium GW2011_GWC2_37_14]